MDTELINLYISKLLNEIGELTKSKLLLQTQLEYNQLQAAKQTEEIIELQLQIEKLQKKKGKKNAQDAQPGEDNF